MQQHFFLGSSPLGFHRVAYTEWGVAQTRNPIICAHGLTRNGRDFDRLAAQLGTQTRVLCPDIIGRGQSDWMSDPTLYGYPQYIADMTALIARCDSTSIDWVGTSMGGIIGMMLAAMPNTPIRRLIINDVGPFLPFAALKRIADYIDMPLEFPDLAAAERHLRKIYLPFGITKDEDWRDLTATSVRRLPNGKLSLGHDPSIGKNFQKLTDDVDFWSIYDKISCPTLLLRGEQSDILLAETAQEMTQRGPKAHLVEFPNIGHAPALMDPAQITIIADFLKSS